MMSKRMMAWALGVVIALSGLSVAGCATAGSAQTTAAETPPEVAALLRYLERTNTTGFLLIRDGEVLIDDQWPAPEGDRMFANFTYGHTASGVLLEDVASQQKSFVAVLVAIAIDRGLIDVDQPVSTYLGDGWSRASPAQEAAIRVIDVLTMSTGLDERFDYVTAPGTTFFYNTPVYAITKDILIAASDLSLDTITRDWLTAPLGMVDTGWRQRPAALASVGNATALVTTPHDVALFGQMILDGGLAHDGQRVVSQTALDDLFARSDVNPAYGRLWWLNGGAYTVRAAGARADGQLIPSAPGDLVGAFGAFERRLYIVPSQRLVVVRTGASTNDPQFDEQLWRRLIPLLD